ncbi:MAG: hypothetical protein J6X18_12895 [Bacteroidales bacterium]|nr:hypothetical protein [Bacteroidales bacterium]
MKLFGDYVLDDADNFADYGNGVLIARVVKDGNEMYIDTNGKKHEF